MFRETALFESTDLTPLDLCSSHWITSEVHKTQVETPGELLCLYMLYFKMACVYCCSCLVCVCVCVCVAVVVLCVLLLVVLCVLL